MIHGTLSGVHQASLPWSSRGSSPVGRGMAVTPALGPMCQPFRAQSARNKRGCCRFRSCGEIASDDTGDGRSASGPISTGKDRSSCASPCRSNPSSGSDGMGAAASPSVESCVRIWRSSVLRLLSVLLIWISLLTALYPSPSIGREHASDSGRATPCAGVIGIPRTPDFGLIINSDRPPDHLTNAHTIRHLTISSPIW